MKAKTMKHVERIVLTEEELLLAVGNFLHQYKSIHQMAAEGDDSVPPWVMDWCITDDGKEGKSDYEFDWDFYKGKMILKGMRKDKNQTGDNYDYECDDVRHHCGACGCEPCQCE